MTKISFRTVILLMFSALLLAACDGDDGAAGPAGAAGAAGASGSDGFSCWDLNQNGIGDNDEDLNGDGTVDTLDCRAPLPGTAIVVSGKVSTALGPLDRFVTVSFVPVGGAMADAVDADVANDGSYSVELDEGDYDVYAGRPGYEDMMEMAFSVVDGAGNVLDFDLMEVVDGEYIGSAECGECHTIEYASFKQTGHPFKLNRAFGEQPVYPFTSLTGVLQRIFDDDADIAGGAADPNVGSDNSLGTPVTYDDVSYVIGGYFWKARFVDAAGAIVTGSNTQYNFKTDAMVAYNNNVQDKPYNCGNCHTTGWRHQDDVLNDNRQDNLPFMDGTFHAGGIQCESCHGAGARHAKFRGGVEGNADARTLAELTADDAAYGVAVACGECHTRDGERDYPTYVSKFDQALADNEVVDTRPNEMGGRIAASGGLVKHHEQYDEALGIDPDTLQTVRSPGFLATHGNCNTCHNPHGSSVNVNNPAYTGMPGVDTTSDTCLACHPDYSPQLQGPGMQNLECGDCHMPKLAKSATKVDGEGSRPPVGDVTSHIFTILLDSTSPQFTADGKFAYPAIDEDWACRTCHNLTATAEAPFETNDAFIDTYIFHTNIVD